MAENKKRRRLAEKKAKGVEAAEKKKAKAAAAAEKKAGRRERAASQGLRPSPQEDYREKIAPDS